MRGGAKIDNNNNRIAFVFNPCLRQVYSGARPGRRRRGLFGCVCVQTRVCDLAAC